MKKIGLGLLLVLMPCFLWAEPKLIDGRWFKISDNPTWLVDFKTAKNGVVWVKEIIPEHTRKRRNSKAYYAFIRYDALCNSNKILLAEIVLLDKEGRVTDYGKSNFDYELIMPNSTNELLFEVACRNLN